MPNSFENNTAMEIFLLFEGKPTSSYIPEIHVSDKHLHKELEMAFVETGTLKIRVKGTTIEVKEGELISICGSALHQYVEEAPGTTIIKTKFMKEWLIAPFLGEREKEACQHLYTKVFVTKADPFFRSLFGDMAKNEGMAFNDIYVFSQILEFTAYVLNHPDCIREARYPELEGTRHMDDVLHFLQTNCSKPLTLSMLAEHLGLSESYCSKYFKQRVGLTFVDYVNALRVNNAQRLLINTGYSIIEIAEQTGFASIQTFNRVFKSQTGMAPSAYRKMRKRS